MSNWPVFNKILGSFWMKLVYSQMCCANTPALSCEHWQGVCKYYTYSNSSPVRMIKNYSAIQTIQLKNKWSIYKIVSIFLFFSNINLFHLPFKRVIHQLLCELQLPKLSTFNYKDFSCCSFPKRPKRKLWTLDISQYKVYGLCMEQNLDRWCIPLFWNVCLYRVREAI